MDASLRAFVVKRSVAHCEYCQIPQKFSTELFQIEHIVARQHRGMAIESNLAVACSRLNNPRRVELRLAINELAKN